MGRRTDGYNTAPMTPGIPTSPPVGRADYVAWILSALVLGLILHLHLLSALLAALLVYKLVDVLTPWLRVRALGGDAARILAVTLISTVVIAALVGIGVGIATLLRSSGQTLPALLQRMAEILEE